ncbi:MAG: YggS family pyridoxal phosphate-dependent enzyme [Planctomycetota bacterium]
MSKTAERFTEIRARMAEAALRGGHDPAGVDLVAVAKTATAHSLQEAWDAGQRIFGHNRVEALEAHRLILPEAHWHLLGPLQGRKVRRGIVASACYQALGESQTLQRCASAVAETNSTPYPVLLQINLNPEDGRYGCRLAQLDALVTEVNASEQLHFSGLMALALADAPEAKLRADFSTLFEHFQRLQKEGQLDPQAYLSMGMSQDFEIAIEEGANLVRVGRALFPPAP